MDELAKFQKQTGDEIQRVVGNFTKDPADRKTLPYLTGRLHQLETLWDEFEVRDNTIRSEHDDQLSHPYFAKEYYESIQKIYERYQAKMSEMIGSLTPETGPSGSQDPKTHGQTDEHQQDTNAIPASKEPPASKTMGKHSPLQRGLMDTQFKPLSTMQSPSTRVLGIIKKYDAVVTALRRIIQTIPVDEKGQSDRYYLVKVKMIERYWNDIQSLHQEIWNQLNEPKVDGYDSENHFLLEDEVQAKIIELYDKSNQSRKPSSFEAKQTAVKLPEVVLPKFDGDYLKWRQFSDLFMELIHNQNIADCHKMWYLKSSLVGDAERLVRHFTVSDANYEAAWGVITERYENKRVLVTTLLNKLLSQPSMNVENVSTIRALHDTTKECLLGLKNLEIETTHWDPVVLHILIKRLDRTTHTLWEQSLTEPRSLPSMKDFLKFLETRFQSLEALGGKMKPSEDHYKKPFFKAATSMVTLGPSCNLCKGQHQLFSCQRFLRMSPSSRLNTVRSTKLCSNCLKSGHSLRDCQSRGCLKCSQRHNTLIHTDTPTMLKTVNTPSTDNKTIKNTVEATGASKSTALTTSQPALGYVLLSTVMVNVCNDKGLGIECRAILDSGSQLNFITNRIAERLGLEGVPEQMSIEGIGQRKHKSQKRVSVTLQSRVNGFTTRIEAHVLSQIISPQPTQTIDVSSWSIPHNVALADPNFYKRGGIDLLIGAEIYYSILAVGQIKLNKQLPTLQNTVFGWTVAGKLQGMASDSTTCGICTDDQCLSDQIEKFWRLEEVDGPNTGLTTVERQCETHFNQTHRRGADGRFILKLPFQGDPRTLGESKDIAYKRFMGLERKLNSNKDLKEQYIKFMEEYQQLGHMKEVNVNCIHRPYYFMPHHAVVKPDSSTTKLRVVFDASAKTTTDISLNDILHVGPLIQDDVFTVLLRFRLPRFVFTADIEKMYRQIQVNEDDQQLQLVWWRNSPTDQLKCFQLSTVTYGTACAPYLAVKCLRKLAEEDAETHPLGSQIIKQNFYVDDVLSGSDSIVEAMEMQRQLQSILIKGGFRLRKWCANHSQLLRDIPQDERELQLDFSTGTEEHIKTMGLIWSPKNDSFRIKASQSEDRRVTKRTIASDVAHLFDPLGIMGPVVVVAKLFLQKLWNLKLQWDAALPQEHSTYWTRFKESLKILNDINFPRHIFSHRTPNSMQLHIFTDASERAFGAAAYVRATDKNNIITVRLLCAKSRIAPLKQQTLPRLELCAAKLGAGLAQRIKLDLKLNGEVIYLWTDSEVTLAWINSTSSSLQTFVANRVAYIQQATRSDQWHHVPSKQNPADIISRGIPPERLAANNLWFYGPMFLHGAESMWPAPYVKKGEPVPELKGSSLAITVPNEKSHFLNEINHKNSFNKLQRIVAYMLRFINNTRKLNHSRTCRSLDVEELETSMKTIIRHVQKREFKDDIKHLELYGETPRSSTIVSLAPFIDNEDIIRVGGRLQASNLPYDSKHPILLPHSHPIAKLILDDIHKKNLHVGAQTLLALARQKFWPLKGKTLARSIVHHCVHCARAQPKLLNQLMGSLPTHRVQPARPFVNSGVDFAGPVWTHFKIRGKRPQKAYIAVFCCFATKAVHLELVSDLTTEGFLGALKRFMARRGHCRHIYCDNATNFVGARNQLQEVKEFIEGHQSINKIKTECSSKGTDFHLIPPRAPHFGGLWEAAVKSAKHLLKSTLAAASLTYEEMETVITEVEAIMNSRPIVPMSNDPNDLMAFTPGHFLVGEPLIYSVETHAEPLKANLLTRWRLVTHLKTEFWRRWHSEYLNHLQYRSKWKQRIHNVQPGTMVVVKEDNSPALKWHLGRIIETFNGADGLVRVADVRTSTGIIRRAIHKLAPLPVETHEPDLDEAPIIDSDGNSKDKVSAIIACATTSQQGRKKEKETIPRKKARRSLGTALVTLLLTCLIVPFASSAPVTIFPFESQPGIYFETLGPSNIISNEWNLVAYFNMEPYWKEFEIFTNYSNKLEYICSLIEEKNACSQIHNQFKHLKGELAANNILLVKQNTHRARRGAIDFVGNIANALFGVLDSEYAKKMSVTIEKVERNEVHLLDLIKNHTSVLDATINIMRKDQQAASLQFQTLERHINKVTEMINGIEQEIYQERLTQSFTSIAIQAMLIASNFHRIQNAILDVMVDAHSGRISPQLISPTQLQQEITTIKSHLAPALMLPAFEDDILSFYNLLTIEGRVEAKHIIFKIKVPLLAAENFELFHIIPVPVKFNETFIAIRPSFPFLMLNLHRDQYYPLTEQELVSCISLKGKGILCNQNHPMYRKGSTVSACEINFISQSQQSPVCQIVKTERGPHWIQLHTPNQWIYSLDKKTTINVVCNNTVTQHTLELSGRMEIQAGCVIKQQLITIQGHNLASSMTRLGFVPSTNLSDTITPNQLAPALRQTHHYVPHLDELADLKKRLMEMHNELPERLTSNYTHQYTVSYAGLLLILITITCLAWKYQINRRCAQRKTEGKNSAADPNAEDKESSREDFTVRHDI